MTLAPEDDPPTPRAEAEEDALARPAAAYLAAVPWEGPSPDPDALDAATFLAWL
jgi:hypothetical protein